MRAAVTQSARNSASAAACCMRVRRMMAATQWAETRGAGGTPAERNAPTAYSRPTSRQSPSADHADLQLRPVGSEQDQDLKLGKRRYSKERSP